MTRDVWSNLLGRSVPILLALTLGACAATPQAGDAGVATAALAEPVPTRDDDPLGPLADASPGAVVALSSSNVLGSPRVRVISEYRAASGRLCRQVAPLDTERHTVICRRANGLWSPTRALTPVQTDHAKR